MAKDPAFLFYTQDFSTGTQFFSDEQLGKYLRLLMAQHQHGHLSEKRMMLICKVQDEEILAKFSKDGNGFFFNERLEKEANKRKSYTESRRKARTKADEDNVRVYIVRDNVRGTYKIGSSVNPARRYNELCNQASPAICADKNPQDRDLTLLWYSDPVLRSVEKELHGLFSDKNIGGEWFSLNSKDLKTIFKKFKGTHTNEHTIERTNDRTEDENENKDENKDENENEKFFENDKNCSLELYPTFNDFWKLYDKKIDWEDCEKKWLKLNQSEKEKIIDHLPAYVESTPEKQYRKNPETYLNDRAWENEIIQKAKNNGNQNGKRGIDKREQDRGIIEAMLKRGYDFSGRN